MNQDVLAFEDVTEGQEIPPLKKKINLVDMVRYGSSTWDFVRSHYDYKYVKESGFNSPFVDGQMLGAFLAQLLVDWVGDPEMLKKLAFRYKDFIYPGSTLLCKGRVQCKYKKQGVNTVECDVWIEDENGKIVLGPGKATLTFNAN